MREPEQYFCHACESSYSKEGFLNETPSRFCKDCLTGFYDDETIQRWVEYKFLNPETQKKYEEKFWIALREARKELV